MDVAIASAVTGMKASEITGTEESPAGDLIHLFDGSTLIVVPADRPDAEGKSGLMLLTAPHDPYTGSFPVFAQPGELAEEVTAPVESEAVPEQVAVEPEPMIPAESVVPEEVPDGQA